jgi:hypothetical protein
MGYPKLVTAKAIYDFAVDGGATGTITPVATETIPANAIIVDIMTVCTTACTSGGSATVRIGAGGLFASAAVAFDNASLADEKVTVNAVADKTTANGAIQVVVAVAALTAGVIEAYVTYYQSDISA